MGKKSDEETDEGLIKRPMRGSVKRVSDRVATEINEKSPAEAVRDDFGGPSEPTDEEHEHLKERVDEARQNHPGTDN